MITKNNIRYSGRIVVKLKRSASSESARQYELLQSRYPQISKVDELRFPEDSSYGILTVEPLSEVFAVAEKLQGEKQFEWVELSKVWTLASRVPNDVYYSNSGTDWSAQWAPQHIGAPKLWDKTTGSPGICIAMLDSGIALWPGSGRLSHPDLDLQTRYILGPNLIHPSDRYPEDDSGHGTRMTGIAAAMTDNEIGIAGLDWSSYVYVVKMAEELSWDESLLFSAVHSAISFTSSQKLKLIVNLSLGAPERNPIIFDSCLQVAASGGLICAAAGNTPNYGPSVNYPAAYAQDIPSNDPINRVIISVGASDQSDRVWEESCRGPELLCVAPGVKITTTQDNEIGYVEVPGGTSEAAAHATGMASLIWSLNPEFDAAGVKDALLSSLQKIEFGSFTPTSGYGRLAVDLGGKPCSFAPFMLGSSKIAQHHTFYRDLAGQIVHSEFRADLNTYKWDMWAGGGCLPTNPNTPAAAGQPTASYNRLFDDKTGWFTHIDCHIFYKAYDGNIVHRWWDGNFRPGPYLDWSYCAGPSVKGYAALGDPQALHMNYWDGSQDTQTLAMFYRGEEGRVICVTWRPDQEGPTTEIWAGSGASKYAPEAGGDPIPMQQTDIFSPYQVQSHIFYRTDHRDMNGSIIHLYRDDYGIGNYQVWAGRGSNTGAHKPAVGNPAALFIAGDQHLFYTDIYGDIQHVLWKLDTATFKTDTWAGSNSVSGAPRANGNPTVIKFGSEIHLFYRDGNNNLQHVWWDGVFKPDNYLKTNTWIGTNGLLNAPLLASDPESMTYFDLVNDNPLQQIVSYRDDAGFLQQVWFTPESNSLCWQTLYYNKQPDNKTCVTLAYP